MASVCIVCGGCIGTELIGSWSFVAWCVYVYIMCMCVGCVYVMSGVYIETALIGSWSSVA